MWCLNLGWKAIVETICPCPVAKLGESESQTPLATNFLLRKYFIDSTHNVKD